MFQRYINPELIKDLERRLSVKDIFEWIDDEAQKLASLGMIGGDAIHFTKNLLESRKIIGLVSREEPFVTEDACIKNEGAGFIVYYVQSLPPARIRFAIAHEIGHTYWMDGIDCTKPLSPMQAGITGDQSIEYLCDRFASALLIPRKNIYKALKSLGCHADRLIPSLHVISILADKFHVAPQAITRRLYFELYPRKLVIVCIRDESIAQTMNLKFDFGRVNTKVSNRDQTQSQWKVIWCALPGELQMSTNVEGYKIPLKSHGRKIPNEMIPKEIDNITSLTVLDGRWKYGIQAHPDEISKMPLKYLQIEEQLEGYACKINNEIFLGIPI